MHLFLNAGFGDPLGVAFLRQLRDEWHFAGIRQDISTAEKAPALCGEIAAAPIQAILIVGGRTNASGAAVPPAEIAETARQVADTAAGLGLFEGDNPCAIEIGNEPDNPRMMGYHTNPAGFADAVSQSTVAIREVAPKARVIVGGVMSLSRDSLKYLERANTAGLPGDCILGYHSYRRTPETPAAGQPSREEEFRWLKAIAADRPIWCTEIGWHDGVEDERWGPFKIFKRTRQYSPEQVADFCEREIRINATQGAVGLVWYQERDGEDRSDKENCFGIRTVDGTWKPVAHKLASLGPIIA